MSSNTSETEYMVDALVNFAGDIFESNFIYDLEVKREVIRSMLNSGKLADYAGQKFDILQKAMDGGTTKDPFELNRTSVTVSVGLDPAQRADVQSVSPDVDIHFTESTSMPHGKANALRTVMRAQALSMVTHNHGTIIDIGGNYLQASLSAVNRNYEIHCCTLKDDEVEFHRQLQRDVTIDISQLPVPDYCTAGAENCTIGATQGICIHALTTIDPSLWVQIFRNHRLSYVVCFFHYDVAIEAGDDVGFMPAVDMHWARDGNYIQCHFDNDSSHSYTHRRDWMIRYGENWDITEPDWEYVLSYRIEYIKDGIAKSSFTRHEKCTLGVQESIAQYRYLDVDDCMQISVPHFDASRGKAVTDPYAYTLRDIVIPSAVFAYMFKFGISSRTVSGTALTLDDFRNSAHSFNHVRRVNGTSITTPYRLRSEIIEDAALGVYLAVAQRSAANRVNYEAYTKSMLNLQKRYGDENVVKLIVKAVAYTAITPYLLLAQNMSQAIDVYTVYMRKAVSDNLVTVEALPVKQYRLMNPIRTIAGTAERGFTIEHDPLPAPEPSAEVDPTQFYNVFKDTLTSDQRKRVEEYIQTTPSEVPERQEQVAAQQEQSENVDEPTREIWHNEYDDLQDYLDQYELPPITTVGYTNEQRTDAAKVWQHAVPMIREYMLYCLDVGLHTMGHAQMLCRDTWGGDMPRINDITNINITLDENIKYYVCKDGHVVDMPVEDAHMVVLDPRTKREHFTFKKGGKVMIKDIKVTNVFTAQFLKIFNSYAIASRARKLLNTQYQFKCEAILVDGVAGCGKTYRIIRDFQLGDIILTTVRETCDATYEDLAKDERFIGQEQVLRSRVRTVDSANRNGIARAKTLFVDEGLMTHAGAIAMAVAEARPKKVVVYGDCAQIPFIDRGSRIGNLHFQSLFYWTQILEVNETVRCPADAIWVSRKFYNEERQKRIFTFSPIMRSIEYRHETDTKAESWEAVTKPWVIATILRCDMEALVTLRPDIYRLASAKGEGGSSKVKVSSVHEIQGRTKPLVFGMRISPFNPDVVNSPPHCNVFFTRHTQRFVIQSSVTDDIVSKYAQQAMAATDEELRAVMLPTPAWLQERMQKEQEKYAKYI